MKLYVFMLFYLLQVGTIIQLALSVTCPEDNRVKMGVEDANCDDANTNLTMDWDGSAVNYTCYSTVPFEINLDIKTLIEHDTIPNPECYMPPHYCMNIKVDYPNMLPTYQGHRPLWAVFGEYYFVPPQRWLHNVEHGSIVMLYHPCANPIMVNKLRKLVTGCIRKHVIARDSMRLTEERPLALIAWGVRMTMNFVDTSEVIPFIMKYALRGPEAHYSKEGQYSHELIRKAAIPFGSTYDDSKLCPFVYI
ncbi:hypothetical protein RDWZM_007558 [Blomia tropicalis]|uniref:Uncharacterized protein n=1 Tax=Blomia tropicalis TaxID=40697 RepID=A0A9Q0RKJ5_BLOTA|nr:hypothetical protein RDWZM_007558 [Blomia tropicalis]